MADKKFRFPIPDFSDNTGFYLGTLVDMGDGTFAERVSTSSSTVGAAAGNIAVTVLSSAIRTATTSSATQTNPNARGVHVSINISVSTASTASLVPKIQAQDPVSTTWYDLLIGTALTTTGITVLKVYPGIGVVSGGAASDVLPLTWRVAVVPGTADPVTYSVGAQVVL